MNYKKDVFSFNIATNEFKKLGEGGPINFFAIANQSVQCFENKVVAMVRNYDDKCYIITFTKGDIKIKVQQELPK